MTTPNYILSEESLTYIDDTVVTIHKSHPKWDEIVQAIKADDWDTVKALASIKAQVRNYVHSTAVEMQGNQLFYCGEEIRGPLVDRIIRMMDEGFDVQPMIRFLENLMENPSKNSVDQLYTFLDVNQLPITEDGYFMAYKRVKADFKDCYSNSVDNSPGQVIAMPRNRVDDDKNRTCSYGYHVASLPYLKHYWGEKLVAVKVHPRDVVSVPTDYNGSKMRVCRYEVVKELPMSVILDNNDVLSEKAVYDNHEEWVVQRHNPQENLTEWLSGDDIGWTDDFDRAAKYPHEYTAYSDAESAEPEFGWAITVEAV